MFCDSKGRLWLLPFRKSLCYYYNGKLHTQKNDSLLKRIRITDNIFFIAEDKNGTVAIGELSKIHLIKGSSVREIELQRRVTYITAMACDSSGIIRVNIRSYQQDTIYMLSDNKLIAKTSLSSGNRVYNMALGKSFLVTKEAGRTDFKSFSGDSRSLNQLKIHINFSILSDSLFSDNTHDGSFVYNCNNPFYNIHYLPGKTVSSVYKDNEQNLWFCTQREGVYKLNSPFVYGQTVKDPSGKLLGVYSLLKNNGIVWIGTEEGYIFSLQPSTGKINKEPYTKGLTGNPRNSLRVLLKTKKGELVLGLQGYVKKTNSINYKTEGSLKDLANAYDNNIIVSTSSGMWVIDGMTLKESDTLWQGRTTAGSYSDGIYYIGTLEGLYLATRDKQIKYAGEKDSLLRNRIAAIRQSKDGTFWIATYDKGILIYKNSKLIDQISKKNGLSSNICRTLFIHGNNLWVGTDNGLNKVNIGDKDYPIIKYTTADGLISNSINTVVADDSLVYVGTPEGISYFDDKKISPQASCVLRITDISAAGNSLEVDVVSGKYKALALARKENNIRFEFAGISYRSGGEMSYRYKLIGLDTGWHATKENFLNYPTLSPGDYVMEIQAINKFGIGSDVIRVPFTINKYWWEKIWVGGLLILLLAGILYLVVSWRIRRIRKRENEKNQLLEQAVLMEHMALKAQMNPHFIFNSLNSIQQYVVDKDVVGANRYLAAFSRLIRLTLDNSSKSAISIAEEIKYLSQYLELEMMRTDNKFSYTINIPEEILESDHTISPMLLQPFIENSIRHGILYRKDSEGHIHVKIKQYENGLRFTIEDNGVGREQSAFYKSKTPIKYQSKGIVLTKQRVDLINRNKTEKVKICITDIKNEIGAIEGTRVILDYPHSN